MPTNGVDILLVEDNPADMELTLHALQNTLLSERIHVARDGQEALDYLFAGGVNRGQILPRPLKLVLLDLNLPKLTGMEVLRAIKSDPHAKIIPVIMLTTSREERDLVESYSLGANSYVHKPVDFEQFEEVVSKLCLYWLQVNQPPPASAFQSKQRRQL